MTLQGVTQAPVSIREFENRTLPPRSRVIFRLPVTPPPPNMVFFEIGIIGVSGLIAGLEVSSPPAPEAAASDPLRSLRARWRRYTW